MKTAIKTPIKIGLAFCALMLAATAASAAPVTYVGPLSGASQSPPVPSPATGSTIVVFDMDAHTLTVNMTFSGLLGTTTAAHIHCCTADPGTGNAGVASETPTFSGFPLGVSSGSYSMSYDTTLASSWSPTFLANHGGTTAGAEAALGAGLASGTAYLNIHTNLYSAGEIRGNLAPIPEPGTWAMLLLGIPAVLGLRRRATLR
jgi:hypothetical protein